MGDMVRYWIGFNKVSGIGPARLRALIKTFGDVESAWNASPEALGRAGMPSRVTPVHLVMLFGGDLLAQRPLSDCLWGMHSGCQVIDFNTRWQVIFGAMINSTINWPAQ